MGHVNNADGDESIRGPNPETAIRNPGPYGQACLKNADATPSGKHAMKPHGLQDTQAQKHRKPRRYERRHSDDGLYADTPTAV